MNIKQHDTENNIVPNIATPNNIIPNNVVPGNVISNNAIYNNVNPNNETPCIRNSDKHTTIDHKTPNNIIICIFNNIINQHALFY